MTHGIHITPICLQSGSAFISTLLFRNKCAAICVANFISTPNPDCCQRVSRGTLLSSNDSTLLATSLVRTLWWDGALRALVPTAVPKKELLWLSEHALFGKKGPSVWRLVGHAHRCVRRSTPFTNVLRYTMLVQTVCLNRPWPS
jgi:hypothetical protein